MSRVLSIVQARRTLGRVAEDVRRGGEPVVLTRRGRPVAQIVAATAPGEARFDALGALRGSITLNGTLAELQQELRALRADFAAALDGNRSRRKAMRKRKHA